LAVILRYTIPGCRLSELSGGKRQMFLSIIDSEMLSILTIALSSGAAFYLVAWHKLRL